MSQLGAARDNSRLHILGLHSGFQQQRLGSPVQESKKIAAVVVDSEEVVDKDGSNSASTSNDVQGIGSDSAYIRK